ncbi:MAG TPA: FAD-dependent oxidoreductase [Thermoanaerobaculia bacterium]|nr:FAD-dependent oxidoreductase [Thermoanaerobaculia bacterium]
MSRERFDVVVLGGGTAGLVTASGCARLGRRVALVEKEALGGDCLWTGCVPTKALVASARLAHAMRHAERWGLSAVEPAIEARSVMEAMRETQRITQKHDDPEKFRRLGIEVIFGEGRLVSPREVAVGARVLAAKDVVLATGSRTRIPEVEGLEAAGFLDHVSFLAQDSFPRSVIILGGGAIATEFAQLLCRFGSDVTVVERGDGILAREDDEVRDAVLRRLRADGVDVRLRTTAVRARAEGGRKLVTVRDASGRTSELAAAEIFVATGRRGNVESLGLDAAGVRVEGGFVVADRWLRTTAPRVWACGDVHGDLLFTHVAAYEAVALVRNLLFPGRRAVDYSNVPWAVYVDPELARVGMTERQAVERWGESKVRAWRVEMSEVDRAVTDRATEGFVKIVTSARGRILGAHAFCAGASTLIAELVLAKREGVKIGGLATLVSPYPSLADAVAKAGAQYYGALSEGILGRLARRVAAWTQR